jgi:serine/threonine-protein kinase HipA
LSTRTLEVWCFDAVAGVLEDSADGLTFAYSPAWVTAGRPPLSQSMPLDDVPTTAAATAFFGGLLPEGTPRGVLARQLGVSVGNDFSLLEALGGDTAGAITLLPPGKGPPASVGTGDVTWLDDVELAHEIEQLPSRPMHIDDDGEYRLSLAGAQDKLPVVVSTDGRVGLTKGRTPSTHIMKTPIPGLENTVVNEAMCLDLGRRLDIPVAAATPRRAGDRECLLVARYDREPDGGSGTRRLHQEDFCQALGIPTQRKYQAEGGPTLPDCFGLLRQAATVPARDAVHLLDYVTLSFLVGNHDAHGKNYSLLYQPDRTELAPAYDILSTFVYRGALRLSRKMAMSIGSEYRPDWVRGRHLDEMLGASGLGPAAARRRIGSLATAAPEQAQAARDALAADGWDAPVLGRVVDMVEQRSGWLRAATAPQGSRTARA